jgi:hypothetical protein
LHDLTAEEILKKYKPSLHTSTSSHDIISHIPVITAGHDNVTDSETESEKRHLLRCLDKYDEEG